MAKNVVLKNETMATQLQYLTLVYTKQSMSEIWRNNEHIYKKYTAIPNY